MHLGSWDESDASVIQQQVVANKFDFAVKYRRNHGQVRSYISGVSVWMGFGFIFQAGELRKLLNIYCRPTCKIVADFFQVDDI